jgi:hypothetical protein
MDSVRSAIRYVSVFVLIIMMSRSLLLVLPVAYAQPLKKQSITRSPVNDSYVLVGGQNGTWFRGDQWPKLIKISHLRTVTELLPASGNGAVWTGAWNGSQWLISGYGEGNPADALNPFIYLYDGHNQILAGTQHMLEPASWNGGDIFAASYNGREWLISGLGSGPLSSNLKPSNHMALGLFDGYNITDLSFAVPHQWDAILYANAWNGHNWLVGGGWEGNEGVLFRFDGSIFTDLVGDAESVISNFHSVQAIEWNGDYWLIGGVGFLAKYDGRKFSDLTPQLDTVINSQYALDNRRCCNSVNALAWNGTRWMIGGGAPITSPQPLTAWLVTYDGDKFTDLQHLLPSHIINAANSSILTITYTTNSWLLAGYANDHGLLLSYTNSTITNLSYLVNMTMSTVNWIGERPAPTIRPAQIGQHSLTRIGVTVLLPMFIAAVVGIMLWKRRQHIRRSLVA